MEEFGFHMLLYKNRIVITGGTGRFASSLKKVKTNYLTYFPTKSQLNILKERSILNYLKKKKPKYLIHLAGLSRPLDVHEKQIERSIDLNIIGTANVTKICKELNIKLIYFSTNYVYPGKTGNYKETDPLLPVNNYAWSKLGGETSVQLYKNSLILRVCMTQKPFVHNKAFANVKTSFIFHEDVVKILFKLLNKKGVINLGGKPDYIYNFAKKTNSNIKKIWLRKKDVSVMPFDSSINLSKLKKSIKMKK